MNEKKSVITINVSHEDINDDYGSRTGQSDRCMLAEAFKRRLDLRPDKDYVDVGYGTWTISSLGEDGLHHEVSGRFNPAISKKIREWDEGVRHEPFEINVSFPADWRQRLNGTK